ncbi:MAG: type II toxin-antitoxin system PemK/MazF family toxin [Stellaceae bacterium]
MKRAEIWTVAAGTGYARKPRPVVILQHDRFDATDSLTICSLHDRSDRRAAVPPADRAE